MEEAAKQYVYDVPIPHYTRECDSVYVCCVGGAMLPITTDCPELNRQSISTSVDKEFHWLDREINSS